MGYGAHSSRSQWIVDRRRDAALLALGWIVLRFSWFDVKNRPAYVVATIQMVLRQRATGS
jgi:very-short-patch-repair endonuclease